MLEQFPSVMIGKVSVWGSWFNTEFAVPAGNIQFSWRACCFLGATKKASWRARPEPKYQNVEASSLATTCAVAGQTGSTHNFPWSKQASDPYNEYSKLYRK